MSDALRPPRRVLLVGPESETRPVRAALTGEIPATVDRTESVADARDRFGHRSEVDCVVLVADQDGGRVSADETETDEDGRAVEVASADGARMGLDEPATLAQACDRLRAADPTVPVIVSVPTVTPALATALAAREDCRLLPRSASAAETARAVRAALEQGDRRRRTATESSVFEHLLSEGRVHLFVLDEEGRYLYRTPTPSWPHDGDPEGKTPVEYLGEAFADQTERMHRDNLRVIETGEPIYGSEVRFEVGATAWWMRTTKLPWRAPDGTVRGMIAVSFDVTEYKQDERRLARHDERISEFSTYIAHELRTPLQISLGMLDRAREGDERAFEKLAQAHDWMEEIVTELGALSTSESAPSPAGADVDPPSTRIRSLVDSVWEALADEDDSLTYDLSPGATVVADPDVLRLVFENVLKNALENGGPGIEVTVGTVEDGFYVEDDGPAPRPAESSTRSTGPGNDDGRFDISLRVVEELVSLRDWSFSATATADGGARFEVTGCQMIADTPDVVPGDPVSIETNADIGAVGTPGDAEYNPATDTWTVRGAGRNLWGNVNEFHFVWGEADGPVRVEAKLTDFSPTLDHSKAGVMVREDRRPDAPAQFVGARSDDRTQLLTRRDREARTVSRPHYELLDPYPWYRLDVVGDQAVCYASTDGEEWHAVDQCTVPIDRPRLVGLAVCAVDRDTPSEAVFSNVRAVELEPDDAAGPESDRDSVPDPDDAAASESDGDTGPDSDPDPDPQKETDANRETNDEPR
jgi:two-component system aerobic respiration control sensor histidine kinase ArcB